jgi:hypothetical protein
MPSASPRRRPRPWAGGLALALLLAGCGDGRKPVFPVKGQLLDAGGKPAAGARILFHPLDDPDPGAARPIGVVGEDGAFTLTTYDKGDGAPSGTYEVTVDWHPVRGDPPLKISAEQMKDRIAAASKARFKATVEKRPNTLEPFRLN